MKKPKRANLIKENRWAKRNHGKKTDELRRLGVEKALPKPDPERGVFLDFGDFTEVWRKSFKRTVSVIFHFYKINTNP